MKTLSKYRKNKYSAVRTQRPRILPQKEKVWRFRFVQLSLYLVAGVLFLRLVQIQVFGHEKYTRLAEQQYVAGHVQKAQRGLSFDRNHKPLALSNPSFDIGVDKRMIGDPEKLSRKLAVVLKKSLSEIVNKIKKGNKFVILERKIDQKKAAMINVMNLEGVSIVESTERVYPFKEKLAQVLGFVDIDGNGLSGVELQFDEHLRGEDGWSVLQKDARGKKILPISSSSENQKSGDDVVLTIDHVIQTIAEEELSATVSRFNAKGGSVIVTNPHTGEILAMASQPGFDANQAGKTSPETWRIRSITDIFEPGSTFKIVTMMAALENGVKKLDDVVFCENGKYKIFGEVINDPESRSWLSFKNVFKYSSNIGAAKIAQEIGKEKMYKAARNFGFGIKSGVELPGGVSGILNKQTEWSRFSLLAISYGHEVAVTPLQMAMAYGAIANGGKLMKPVIIKTIKSKSQETVSEFWPQSIRRVMSAKTAQIMTSILKEVVADGTGTLARISSGRVAGKTGTAQKPLDGGSGYSNTKYIASFGGFYPADHPEYLIYVAIDEPYPIHSGGHVAAPAFKKILQHILKIYPTPNETPAKQIQKPGIEAIPDLTGRRVETAKQILENLKIQYQTNGSGQIVKSQKLQTDPDSGEFQKIILTLSDFSYENEYVIMPKLTGLSMRRAISELAIKGLSAKVFGSGRVYRQDPEPGKKIKAGARCMLEFKPRNKIETLFN